jgi:AcrR family transcriptional regulator
MSPTSSAPLPAPVRRPGRPAGTRGSQRRRLLNAAIEQLSDPRLGELSLQQLARANGVTPALAYYYFGNQEGLLAAVIEERVAPRIADLVSAARVRAGQPVAALTFLMQRASSLLATDPLLRRCLWLQAAPALALRDQLRAVLADLLARAQRAGLLRADLAVDYLTGSLLGLALFPFFDDAGAADAGGERVAALTLQHVALLQDGIVKANRPRAEAST